MATAAGNTVRIYAVADIHGRPERLGKIRKCVDELGPDLVVAAGDITQFRNAGRTLAQLDRLPVPVLTIRGNSDRRHVETLFQRFDNLVPLHLATYALNGYQFTGVSGTVLLPFRSLVHYREGRILKKLEPLVDRRTVVVTHPPPRGLLDEVLGRFHAGSRQLRHMVTRIRPMLVLFGHIHERGGWIDLNSTVAVNCTMGKGAGGAMIDIVDGSISEVVML